MEPSNNFDTESRAEEHLTRALNFQGMGMTASAEHELEFARQLNPAITSDPRYQTFHVRIVEEQSQLEAWKLPMRVGAGILIADLLISVLLLLVNFINGNFGEFFIWILVHIGVDFYLIINLLRLKETARRATIWWASLGLIVGVLAALAANSWLDLVMQISFSGSLFILLFGKPSKVRTVLAGILFVLGYFGSFCGALIFSILNVLG